MRGPLALTALCVVLPTSLKLTTTPEATAVERSATEERVRTDEPLLQRYCVRCHGPDEQEGDLRFDTLASLPDTERTDVLERMREMLTFREMPPEEEEQPTPDELAKLVSWVDAQTESAGGDALREKLRLPHYGNVVDHDRLFGDEDFGPSSSPARRWLVSPQIFHERVMDVFRLEGRARENMQRRSFHGVTNPFLLNDHSGVRYYDTDALDGGDLLVMLGNAAWIADRQIVVARMLGGEKKIEFPDQRDRWTPRPLPKSYQAFTSILKSEGPPSRKLLEAAVDEQFDCVLRREPRNPSDSNTSTCSAKRSRSATSRVVCDRCSWPFS